MTPGRQTFLSGLHCSGKEAIRKDGPLLKPPEVQTGQRTERARVPDRPVWTVRSLVNQCGPAAGTTRLKTPRKSFKR